MARFILMLTREDRTVDDAMEVYAGLRGTEVRHVGFKDIGLPEDALRGLVREIKRDGRQALLEVVSLSRDEELRSVETAARLGVDCLLGGRHAREAVEVLRGTGIRYFPFAGRTHGHPTRLSGSVQEVVDNARDLTSIPGVHGLDLLAYRFDGDAVDLTREVVAAVTAPVIAAGSINGEGRVRAMQGAGVWGFTVGSALFEGRFRGGILPAQANSILALAGVQP